jgi:RNA polymerase sigma factor (sigma-70 family)
MFGQRFRHITGDDLAQDCWERILAIIRRNRYNDLPDNELINVLHKVVYNLIKDALRRNNHITISITNKNSNEPVIDIPVEDDTEDLVTFQQYLTSLDGKLTQKELNLLQLMIQPDEQLITISIENSVEGKEVRITQRHYAKRLNVSTATISRLMKSLAETIQKSVAEASRSKKQ